MEIRETYNSTELDVRNVIDRKSERGFGKEQSS